MCPPRSCDLYIPDYDRSTSACYGFGYTPPCMTCGKNEAAHVLSGKTDYVIRLETIEEEK